MKLLVERLIESSNGMSIVYPEDADSLGSTIVNFKNHLNSVSREIFLALRELSISLRPFVYTKEDIEVGIFQNSVRTAVDVNAGTLVDIDYFGIFNKAIKYPTETALQYMKKAFYSSNPQIDNGSKNSSTYILDKPLAQRIVNHIGYEVSVVSSLINNIKGIIGGYEYESTEQCRVSMELFKGISNIFTDIVAKWCKTYMLVYEHEYGNPSVQYDDAIASLTAKKNEIKSLLQKIIKVQSSYVKNNNDIPNQELAKTHNVLTEKYNSICSMLEEASKAESNGTDENVTSYINKLDKCIAAIREYFDTFEYKQFITPRKKHIDKMEEYVKGALDRKYSLNIPLYSVQNVGPELKKIIRDKFIGAIAAIVDKDWKEFIILAPDFDIESGDIYIYLTLREPHGKKDDKYERSITFDSKADDELINEAAMSATERNELPNSAFGLPDERRYPLHDEQHVRSAIQQFHMCKPENQSELANNISKACIVHNAVGRICISDSNRFKKLFPEWMLRSSNARMKINGREYKIFIDGEVVDEGVIPNMFKQTTVTESVIINPETGHMYI